MCENEYYFCIMFYITEMLLFAEVNPFATRISADIVILAGSFSFVQYLQLSESYQHSLVLWDYFANNSYDTFSSKKS